MPQKLLAGARPPACDARQAPIFDAVLVEGYRRLPSHGQAKLRPFDMTLAMVERARTKAKEHGYTNVEFRMGEIEHLPVADASVDVIISNCVINLSPEKAPVFLEAFRVLRPGGRLVVSDLVWLAPAPDGVRESMEALVGCVAGASLEDEYLSLIRAAGFRDVEVVARSSYGDAESRGDDVAASSVASVKVRAWK